MAAALFPGWSFYLVPWLAALVTGVLLSALGRRWWQAVGIALMTVPVWDTLWGIAASFEPLLEGGFTLRAYTRQQLAYIYSYKLLSDLGYLGVGFLLHECGGRWSGLWLGPREWARRLVRRGLPTGGRSESSSALLGAVAVPLFILGSLGLSLATRGLDALRQSDESQVFANMTLWYAILLSAAAAVGEELVYRGFLQTVLGRWMPMWLAVVVQAIIFGFAHSGYGTWIHVLLPTLFGLLAGFAAWRFGIWMALAIHFLVDVYAFVAEATVNQPWLIGVLNALFFANITLTLAWSAWWVWGRFSKRTASQQG